MVIYTGCSDTPASSLDKVCSNPAYDVVVLAFASSWTGDGPISLTMDSCTGEMGKTDCSSTAQNLEICRRNGKKILLSLGGANGAYSLASDVAGTQLADRLWRYVLGGTPTAAEGKRPFGSFVLDGIDLDIEGGAPTGYASFVKSLRQLMDADHSHPYFITAAPQCPLPDAWIGPGNGTALGDAPQAFDALFVQYYNKQVLC